MSYSNFTLESALAALLIFEKVTAERHGIRKDNLTKLKHSERFKKIYNDVYNAYIASSSPNTGGLER